MTPLDALDARILLALDDEPTQTTLGLARELDVARNTVHARLRRLEEQGALREPSRRLDPRAMGYELLAFVMLSISQSARDAAVENLARLPEIIEMHAISGEGDLLARVVARDTQHLYELTSDILAIDGILRSNTTIVLADEIPSRAGPLLRTLL
ncbi:Lrp/AsnC family transcriptional regulator [Sanguibacter suaedae]|jgi:DNA-binding Lrp family transcriptional regulator|uniref:Lrp/AsnC family transcriptional regulator n=1 Tax=Sanguibacter suaedae TaxID=2795737 RepID=A0A934I3E2_9MICO|nr:Lrp/AsnC family transcriptional regulator [Sanguibacter suaedae]MBI9113506.1 Lrp/AsnC family transcriptional regulator [Sanguibacter suaedae]